MQASTRNWIAIIAAVVVVAAAGAWYVRSTLSSAGQPVTVSYICKNGNAITATYHLGETAPAPAPGEPPIPTGSVDLRLSDGRSMTLAQTLSADGVRYANAAESFVFWEKGNGALVLENDEQKTYVGCVAVAPEPAGENFTQLYSDNTVGFSIRLPEGYVTDPAYQYQELGPGKAIDGVKFTIPAAMAQGTNLSTDSYLSVEELSQTQDCSASRFLDQASSTPLTDGGTDYSVASTTGAGAGNRYEETVYALPGTNPCLAVRYFIHYGVFENYPAGSVKAFDEAALLRQFDLIRHTLTIAP